MLFDLLLPNQKRRLVLFTLFSTTMNCGSTDTINKPFMINNNSIAFVYNIRPLEKNLSSYLVHLYHLTWARVSGEFNYRRFSM
jgi:hypothetical protein